MIIYQISHLSLHSGTIIIHINASGDGSGIRFGAVGTRKPEKLKLETAVVPFGAGSTRFILIHVPPTTKCIILSAILAYVLHEYRVFV